MDKMLKESTSSDIFNPFLNLTSQALRINPAQITPQVATHAVRTLGEFTQRMGCFLKQENNSMITNGTNEIAVGVSIQNNTGSYIHVNSAEQTMQVHVNHTKQHYNNASGYIFIPGSVFEHSEGNILQVMAYNKPMLFRSTSSTVVSPVLSIAIGKKNIETITPLTESITFVFKKNTNRTVSCAYWKFSEANDETNGHWDTTGITKIAETHENITCKSDHLTNFALIVDESCTRPDSSMHKWLYYLSLVCGGVSGIGIIITIVVYSAVKNLRVRIPSKIVVRLCISLLLLTAVFQGFAERRGKGDSVCTVIGCLIHYLLLLSFMWMLIEAVSMFFMFVRPLYWRKMNKSKFLRRATGLSLVVPAIIVTATVVYAHFHNPRHLRRSELCFIQHQCSLFRFGVELPMAIVLCFNTLVLLWSAIAIQRQSKTPGQSSGQLNSWQKWKITLGMSLMLGVYWLIGVFPSTGIPTQILFDIFCGLQGFFIFILFVLLQEDTRRALCCRDVALVGIPSTKGKQRTGKYKAGAKLRKGSKISPEKHRVIHVTNGRVSKSKFV